MKTFMVGNLPAPPPQTHKKKKNTRKRLSKKLTTHPWSTPQAIPRAPTMKGFPLQPIGKGCSGCVPVRCVETTLEAKTLGKFISHILTCVDDFPEMCFVFASVLAFKFGPSKCRVKKPQNRGQIVSRQKCIVCVCVCIYTYIYIYIYTSNPPKKNSTNQQRSSSLSVFPPPKKKKLFFLQMLSCKVSISKDGSTSATFSHWPDLADFISANISP